MLHNNRALYSALVCLLAMLLAAAPATAREPKREPPKTKKVQAVSKKVAGILNEANEALQAEPADYATANSRLKAILALKPKLNTLEEALVHQSYGYMYSDQEKYAQAIRAFKTALDLEGLSDSAQLNTQFNLGQLYMIEGKYDEGIPILENWFKQAENPAANAYMLIANAYAQKASNLENDAREKAAYGKAWEWAKQGLEKMDKAKPREPWMRLGAQLNLALEDYKTAGHWLRELVRRWPKENYLKQLTAIYGQLDKPRDALSVMEMARLGGYLDESKEISRLAQLYLYNEIPYKAARLLDENFKSNKLEQNQANYELLANAWTMAREYERALAPLERAAAASENGKLYVRLGQLHIDGERWKPAAVAIRKGLGKGGLESAGEAHLLLGISHFHEESFAAAQQAFERAGREKKTQKSARAWLQAIRARAS